MIQQLPLKIALREETTFLNFCEGDNAALIKAMKASLNKRGEKFIYLCGQPGSGKTHLLQACCHEFQDRQFETMYLPMKTPQLTPEVLGGMESMQLVCLDDVDTVFGNSLWEEALHHFYNRARENGICLFVSGKESPAHSSCQLPDLRSRLVWGLTFHVNELNDAQKIQALKIRARDRGLEFSDDIGQFLLHHFPRDTQALFNLLDQLDHASLVSQRKLTVPFVKRVLEIQ